MIMFVWLMLLTPPQIENLREVFMSSFLAQNRLSYEGLHSYLNQKLIPRIAKGNYLNAAFDGERMVGFAFYEKWAENTYYLAEMAVSPSYQNRGIGKKLVFSIFEKDPTIEKIVLITEIANIWSQAFYEAIGFKRSTFMHPDYAPNEFAGFEYSKIK